VTAADTPGPVVGRAQRDEPVEPYVTKVPHALRRREIAVDAVSRPTPSVVRLRFTGEDLHDLESVGPMDHVKLVFDDAAAPGDAHPPRRDYTLRAVGPGWIEVDVVQHGDPVQGVAGAWASRAAVGDRIAMLGPKSSKVVRQDLDWYVLAVDDTGLPMAARWLAQAPTGARVTLLAEIQSEDDVQELATRAEVTTRWLLRGEAAPGTTSLLAETLKAELSDGAHAADRGFVVVAGEALSLRSVKAHLRDVVGMPHGSFVLTGYWRRGVPDHDHHAEID